MGGGGREREGEREVREVIEEREVKCGEEKRVGGGGWPVNIYSTRVNSQYPSTLDGGRDGVPRSWYTPENKYHSVS